MQRWGDNRGGYRGGGNTGNRGNQPGPRRDPNAMDVNCRKNDEFRGESGLRVFCS